MGVLGGVLAVHRHYLFLLPLPRKGRGRGRTFVHGLVARPVAAAPLEVAVAVLHASVAWTEGRGGGGEVGE